MKYTFKLAFSLSLSLSIFLFPLYGTIQAQTISQDVISSAGNFASFPEGSMAWTIGEVTIETYSAGEFFLTQGFHQPPDRIEVVIEAEFFIPEGFSPNKDIVNDVFFIRGLNFYPKNSIIIFNRWGNKVFEASPYLNNWDGTTKMGLNVGSEELPVGTYFYLFDFGNGAEVLKGTIFLNR